MVRKNIPKNKFMLMNGQLGEKCDYLLPLNTFVLSRCSKDTEKAFIKPKIQKCDTNYVITDVSEKYYQKYAKFLEDNDYIVKKLNLIDMHDSNRYDSIEYIKSDADVSAIMQIFKNMPSPNADFEPVFKEHEDALIYAAISYIARHETNPAKKNLTGVYNLIKSAKSDNNDNTFEQAFANLKASDPYSYSPAVKQYNVFNSATEKTRDSVIIGALARLSLFGSPNISNLTTRDEMDLHCFEDKKIAIFVCIPCENTTYNILAQMLCIQLYRMLEKYVENSCTMHTLPIRCQFIMDKFCNIGQIERFAEMMAVGQKDGISFSIICESVEQLVDIYKDDYNVIIDNCPVKVLLSTESEQTAKWAADILCNGELSTDQLLHLPENEHVVNIHRAYRKFLNHESDL